jgi:hypothetical protein
MTEKHDFYVIGTKYYDIGTYSNAYLVVPYYDGCSQTIADV